MRPQKPPMPPGGLCPAIPADALPLPSVPQSAADLTAAWLSTVLKQPIPSLALTRIGEDQGFMGGGLYRLQAPGLAPLVAKLSPEHPPLRAQLARSNAREVQFYTQMAPGLPVPRCLHAASDPASGASVVLLEDLSHCRAVSFLDGLTVRDAEAVLDALSALHARWWNAPELAPLSGAAILSEFQLADPWARYPEALSRLLPDVSLPPALRALGDYAAAHLDEIYDHMQERGPLTLLHRDPQLDNIVFKADDTALLLDWQMLGKGRGVWDVSYFLVSSTPPDLRRAYERVWVRRYHRGLVARGITGYALEACWQDYLRSVLAKLFVTVFATVELDNNSPHKRAWRRADLARLLAFIEDHDLTPAIWSFDND